MGRPAPLLLAYDGACDLCQRLMESIRIRDRWGLVIAFPLQDPDLLRVAPELAGRPLEQALHGLETATRQVFAGAELLPPVLARLPGWRWLAPLFRAPGVAGLAQRLYLRTAARRCRSTGWAPIR